jgi:hypothetical protein
MMMNCMSKHCPIENDRGRRDNGHDIEPGDPGKPAHDLIADIALAVQALRVTPSRLSALESGVLRADRREGGSRNGSRPTGGNGA